MNYQKQQLNSLTEDMIYKDGIPSTQVQTHSPGVSHVWYFNNLSVTGKTANPHFFKKGNHVIQLKVTDANGCESVTCKNREHRKGLRFDEHECFRTDRY